MLCGVLMRACDRNHEWVDPARLRSEFTRGININRKWINSLALLSVAFLHLHRLLRARRERNLIFHLIGCNLIFYFDCQRELFPPSSSRIILFVFLLLATASTAGTQLDSLEIKLGIVEIMNYLLWRAEPFPRKTGIISSQIIDNW